MTPDQQFEELLAKARKDSNILALWLGGSRGKGLVTADSDYDCWIIVKDEVLEEYRERLEKLNSHGFDLSVSTLDEFTNYAGWNSPTMWDRYSFAHIKALVDKLGIVQEMIDAKATIPDCELRPFVRRSLDHYINQVYRSLKCHRDGNTVGSRLDAAESINPLLDAIFALNGRLRPYHKYLEWELKNYPLQKPGMPSDELVRSVLEIITTGDSSIQRELLTVVEKLFRDNGYGDVFDAWGEDLLWMRQYRPARKPSLN